MGTRERAKALVVTFVAAVVGTVTIPAAADVLTFQQGANGYERGQDTSIRWAYSVNFADTLGYDHSHPGDPGDYELRSTNSGSSTVLEVGQFFQTMIGDGPGFRSFEAGPTYRYSRMMIRFRDVFGTAPGQLPPDATITNATLKLYNTFDLGARGVTGAGFVGETVVVPGGETVDNPHGEQRSEQR